MSFLSEAISLLGFEIKRKAQPAVEVIPSPTPPIKSDGAVTVEATATGATFGTYIDLDGNVKTESELITKYRSMSNHPEVDMAIEAICNEAITIEDDQEIVELNLDDVKDIPDPIKDRLDEIFDEVLDLLLFNEQAWDIFRRWYVDGRIYYQVVIDEKKLKDGILELRYIDPRKIRKIRELERVRSNDNQTTSFRVKNEYFIFNDQGFGATKTPTAISTSGGITAQGIRIAKDSIAYVTSGITDETGKMVLSYLHPAIKPLNQLRAMEDAAVIYRLTRATERRVFYVDVGNLPYAKAEQYLQAMMARHKNRIVYDASDGTVRDDRKFMTMTEDYWMPRKEGSQGTKIETLQGGENLGQMADVEFFLKRLFRALKVPISRLDPEAIASFGRATEITRDEITFNKFIDRIRTRFSGLFLQLLEKQAILKGVCSPEEWEKWQPKIRFKWARDNYYSEVKDNEIRTGRMDLMDRVAPYVGIYYSHENVRKYVLRQSDEDIKENDQQINEERKNPQFAGKVLPGQQPPPDMMDGPSMMPDQGPMDGEMEPQKALSNPQELETDK